MAAIFFKVFTLALRTAAKPVGFQFQAWALQHPKFRQRAVAVAQYLHRMEVWISRGAEGKERKAFVGAMTDEKALNMASKVVSEGFVFTVGVAVLSWEYNRSRIKELEKKASDEQYRKDLIRQARMERERLQVENVKQTELIEELVGRIAALEEKIRFWNDEQLLQTRPWWQMWGGKS